MADDQATLETLLAKVPRMSIAINSVPRCGPRAGSRPASVQGSAPRLNVSTSSWKVENLRDKPASSNGWRQLQTWGNAAIKPTAPACQPSHLTANATTKGKFGRVRFSIGTLKQASMVEYFSDRIRSRLRSRFI